MMTVANNGLVIRPRRAWHCDGTGVHSLLCRSLVRRPRFLDPLPEREPFPSLHQAGDTSPSLFGESPAAMCLSGSHRLLPVGLMSGFSLRSFLFFLLNLYLVAVSARDEALLFKG